MSLFVGNLAFVNNTQYMDGVKIGVLTGSLLSTIFGYLLLLMSSRKLMQKYKIVIFIFFIMFSFLNKSMSENNKSFFDFKIKSITGDQIDFSDYKGKLF